MSNTPSPYPGYASGYASSAQVSSSSSKSSSSKPPPKAANVFTNDGSFLERFQRNRKEDEDKKKEQEALERKKNFDNRFKNRGKRALPDSTPGPDDPTSEDHASKKIRSDEPSTTEYGKQVRSLAGRSLKDTGTGVRPLIK